MSNGSVAPLPEPLAPLADWRKAGGTGDPYFLQASLRHFRADIRLRHDKGTRPPEFTAIRLPRGGDLMWSEPVGDQTVLVIWGATGFRVHLVARSGQTVALVWPAVRAFSARDSTAALMWCIATAELAVETLRHETAEQVEAEAWLRRQLVGLDGAGRA